MDELPKEYTKTVRNGTSGVLNAKVFGKLQAKTEMAILAECQLDEQPWLIICSDSFVYDALAAFGDRVAVFKQAARLGAGALGIRRATFDFGEITGISYKQDSSHGGFIEVMTPSYTGLASSSSNPKPDNVSGIVLYQMFGHNDAADRAPNTLRLSDKQYMECRNEISTLKKRIQQAKRAVEAPIANQFVDVFSQIREMSTLRDQGILTESEFAAAKAKILGI